MGHSEGKPSGGMNTFLLIVNQMFQSTLLSVQIVSMDFNYTFNWRIFPHGTKQPIISVGKILLDKFQIC